MLDRLFTRYMDALRAGATAEALTDIMGEMVPLIGTISRSPIGDAARAEIDRILRRFTQDPYLTLGVFVYLGARIRALEQAADQFIALAAKADYQHGSNGRGLPSPAEIFQSEFVEQTDFTSHLLDATAAALDAVDQLIPSPLVVLGEMQPQPRPSSVPAALQAPALALVPASTPPTPSGSEGLMRLTPHSKLTHGGKTHHLASAAREFGIRLLATLQQHRIRMDRAGENGVYDPVVLRSVADSLRDTIDRARISCKGLATLAHEPVGILGILGND